MTYSSTLRFACILPGMSRSKAPPLTSALPSSLCGTTLKAKFLRPSHTPSVSRKSGRRRDQSRRKSSSTCRAAVCILLGTLGNTSQDGFPRLHRIHHWAFFASEGLRLCRIQHACRRGLGSSIPLDIFDGSQSQSARSPLGSLRSKKRRSLCIQVCIFWVVCPRPFHKNLSSRNSTLGQTSRLFFLMQLMLRGEASSSPSGFDHGLEASSLLLQ